MIGMGDLEFLELTQIPWFSYSLFIVFVLMTYILLFNTLIGMMSETCTSLNRETKHDQWRIEQVSVILLLEYTFFHLYRKEKWDLENVIRLPLYVKIESDMDPTPQGQAEGKPLEDKEDDKKETQKDIPLTQNINGVKNRLLSEYDLTDRKGCLLSRISVFISPESEESDKEDTEPSHNVVDVESHTPGLFIVMDSTTGRRINIQVEEYEQEKETPEGKDVKKDRSKKKSNEVSPE